MDAFSYEMPKKSLRRLCYFFIFAGTYLILIYFISGWPIFIFLSVGQIALSIYGLNIFNSIKLLIKIEDRKIFIQNKEESIEIIHDLSKSNFVTEDLLGSDIGLVLEDDTGKISLIKNSFLENEYEQFKMLLIKHNVQIVNGIPKRRKLRNFFWTSVLLVETIYISYWLMSFKESFNWYLIVLFLLLAYVGTFVFRKFVEWLT